MYCSNCGNDISGDFKFCPQCGTAAGETGGSTTPYRKPSRAFFRLREDRKVAGVCAGIAQYLNIDVTLVRVLIVCLSIWPPVVGLVFYLICWIVVPNEPLLLTPAVDRAAHSASNATVL